MVRRVPVVMMMVVVRLELNGGVLVGINAAWESVLDGPDKVHLQSDLCSGPGVH